MGSYGAGLYAEGIAEGRAEERQDAIGRLSKAGVSDEQLLLAGYTKEEIEKQKSN